MEGKVLPIYTISLMDVVGDRTSNAIVNVEGSGQVFSGRRCVAECKGEYECVLSRSNEPKEAIGKTRQAYLDGLSSARTLVWGASMRLERGTLRICIELVHNCAYRVSYNRDFSVDISAQRLDGVDGPS